MPARKQLAEVIEKVIVDTTESEIESSIIEDYKELNNKCDNVIDKIKIRKRKRQMAD